jgi:hypothetical protein
MSSRDLRRARRLLALTASAALALTGLVMITTTPSSAALPPQCVTAADGVSVTCTYTGSAGAGFPTLTIPNGTTSITVHAVGRRGLSSSNGTLGGNPAVIDATIPTADGEGYLVQLKNDGGAPGTSSSGGSAGKGGGSSTLRKTTSSTPIIQAAGGGGAGNAGGGAPASTSAGGNAETAGAAASATGTPAQGGLPGAAAAGGDGGAGAVIDNCTSLVTLASGNAGVSGNVAGGAGANGGFGGGGGGGGRFGGGGGGAGANGCTSSFGAGGGGGSSTVPAGATSGISTTESAIVRITFALAPRASITATSLAFGNVLLGTSSSEQTVTFTNTGSIPMTLGNGGISGTGASSYEKTADTCSSATLEVGSSCQVSVRFTPASVGDKTADFTIADNSPTSPHVISLTGTGIAPVATLSKTAIDFGNRLVGTTSTSSGFAIKNTGAGSLVIGTPTIAGPNSAEFAFAPGSNCAGASLAAGSTCQILVRFSPSATGARSATVSIPTNAADSPSTVALSGTGTAPQAGVTPPSIDFGVQEVGGSSAPQLVTLSNPGTADLHVTGLTVTGTNAGDFTTSGDTCTGATVAPGGSCVVSVTFAPGAGGDRSATLGFASDGGPATVSLAGIGLPPADLKVLGTGSVYTGRDHLVTRTVDASGDTMTYKLGVLNEDSVAHSYRIRLTPSGAAATAAVWASGFNAKVLPTDADGSFVTPSIGAGKVVLFQLKVTPTAPGQVVAGVGVDLLTDTGLLIEGLDTETNTAAPTAGTSSFELFAKQGTQPYVGGPVDGQTATGPALNVGQSSIYTLRLKNDGATPQQIGLKLTDVDGCAGSFTTTVKVGTKVWTTEAFAGTYLTPVLLPGRYTQVTVTVKRIAAGCAAKNLRVQSLDGGGGVVRTSYLLTNAAYNATTD